MGHPSLGCRDRVSEEAPDVARVEESLASAPAAAVVQAWLAARAAVRGPVLFAGPGAVAVPVVPAEPAARALAQVLDVPGEQAALAAPGGALVALVVQAELAAWVGAGRLAAVVGFAAPLLPGVG
jgi:hypothetical protein